MFDFSGKSLQSIIATADDSVLPEFVLCERLTEMCVSAVLVVGQGFSVQKAEIAIFPKGERLCMIPMRIKLLHCLNDIYQYEQEMQRILVQEGLNSLGRKKMDRSQDAPLGRIFRVAQHRVESNDGTLTYVYVGGFMLLVPRKEWLATRFHNKAS